MYNVTIHCQQFMGAATCAVSLTETTEDGFTYPLSTMVSSSDLLASADEDPLWIFLQQVQNAVSTALGNDEPSLWWQHRETAAMDGGWGGAGRSGQPERSEDE